MAPVRYRYVSERDIQSQTQSQASNSPARASGGAIENYARLMKASEALVAKQQVQNIMYQTLLQKVVLSQWKDCVERKKRLAWKVLVALRMKALGRSMVPKALWEEEAGQLYLVS